MKYSILILASLHSIMTLGQNRLLQTENTSAVLIPGGQLFAEMSPSTPSNLTPGVVIRNPDGSNGPRLVAQAGLWLGGIDQEGNIRAGYVSRRNYDFAAGPLRISTGLPPDSFTYRWERIWEVTAEQIAAHLEDLNDNGIVNNPIYQIYTWPGRLNPHFFELNYWFSPVFMQHLAPFHDANGDQVYDPDDGDYPVVRLPDGAEIVPGKILWQVFNDVNRNVNTYSGPPLGFEFQVTAFAFDCPETPDILKNTFFIHHKILNRSPEAFDSLQIGIGINFDIGCNKDDLVGSIPELNAVYGYNRNNQDGYLNQCNPDESLGLNPPAYSVSFLNRNTDRAMFYNSIETIDYTPYTAVNPFAPAIYNTLNCRFGDGTPLIRGGLGHIYNDSTAQPVTHAFPDHPKVPNGWSLYGSPYPELFSMLPSYEAGRFLPGQSTELVTAWALHRSPGADHLENITAMYGDLADLKQLYDCHFGCVCSPISHEEEPIRNSFNLFPNPADYFTTLHFTQAAPSAYLRILDWLGRPVFENMVTTEDHYIPTSTFAPGIYWVQVESKNKRSNAKLIILHH